jgi:hypothetical protein
MAHWKTLATFTNQQTPHLQNGTKTNMDVRTCTMGMYCSLQLSRYPAIPSEDSPTNHKRSAVCEQPHPTHGTTHSASQNGLPRTHRNSSHSTENSSKPSYSTNSSTATQKTFAQKMDARCELLS